MTVDDLHSIAKEADAVVRVERFIDWLFTPWGGGTSTVDERTRMTNSEPHSS